MQYFFLYSKTNFFDSAKKEASRTPQGDSFA